LFAVMTPAIVAGSGLVNLAVFVGVYPSAVT
jgi:hypothetical protein